MCISFRIFHSFGGLCLELTWLQAMVYGVIQGIGEFLPISSSAHLLLLPWLMGWEDPGLAFGVALHMGTLVAVLLFFWKDWVQLILAGVGLTSSVEKKRLFWLLVLATIPGAIIGYLLEELAATAFRSPLLVAATLAVMGYLLFIADRSGPQSTKLEQIRWRQALSIGFAQALAVIPGVSRAGATMTAARYLGLDREAAARFSFLLSTPIILGAGLLEVPQLGDELIRSSGFWIGLLTAAVSGYASIGFLLRYLATRNFVIFAVYRIALALIIVLIWVVRG